MNTTFRMKALAAMAVFAMAAFAGCKGYDDGDVIKRLDDHEQRIATLEDAVKAVDAQFKAGAMIKSVTPVTEAPGGWRIEFTSGTPSSIDILNGESASAPNPTGAPLIEVRTGADGAVTIWYSTDGENWTDTGVNIKGEKGETGATGPQGPTGPQGTPGDDAIQPEFTVDYNDDDMLAIWYNVTEGYPDDAWVELLPIGEVGPIAALVDNDNGSATIIMNDDESTEYTFAKFSAAQSFAIVTTGTIGGVTNGYISEVKFRVNPSTAEIPTGSSPTALSRWALDKIGTRASYVTDASEHFKLIEITRDGDKTGQYIARIQCVEALATDAINEYDMALVLNNSATTDEVLISSNPFTFGNAPLTGFAFDPTGLNLTWPNGKNMALRSGHPCLEEYIVFTPANVTNKAFTVSSNNTSVVSTTASRITASATNTGTADITVTHTATGKAFVFTITVIEQMAEEITLNAQAITIMEGETATLMARVLPSATKNMNITWASSNPEFATVAAVGGNGKTNSPHLGKITAAAPGTTTITATSVGVPAVLLSCEVTVVAAGSIAVPEELTIGGTTWQTRNVAGANTLAADFRATGWHYQFGKAAGYDPAVNAVGWTALTEELTLWDMTTANPCPAGYVVPTVAQFEALVAATDHAYVTENGVSGMRFTDKSDTSLSIFFPATGYRSSATNVNDDASGNYWTNQGDPGPGVAYADRMDFGQSGSVGVGGGQSVANRAFAVRCVKAE